MEFDKKTFLPPLLIFALFFSATASLLFTGLSVNKAVSMQNDITAIFLKSIQSSVVAAIFDSVVYVLQNAVLPLLPFVLFSTLGFLAVLFFRIETKKLALALAGVFASVLILAFVLGQNPALLIIPLGYFALLLPIEFEERKTAFRTGYAFVSYMLRFLGMAAAIAVFIAILMMPDFDKAAEQQMISSVAAMLPDINQLQQAQADVASSFISKASFDVKNIVDNEYSALTAAKQAECSQFKDSVKSEVDSYKSEILSQMQAGNASIGTEQLAQQVFSKIGIFSATAKATPLIAAISLFVLLEFLKPFFAMFGGAVYSLLNRKFGK